MSTPFIPSPAVSSSVANTPADSVKDALHESERRFSAIVSSIPGLVFQMHMTADAQIVFTYLSEGCEALLGIPAAALLKDAHTLFNAMEEHSASQFKQKLQKSAKQHKRLDWEGRIWIADWQDMKWVNIRATVRDLGQGAVQWDGIMLNISQSKHEKQEIEQARRDLQALTAHIHQVKEQERVSIAREIHDDLGGNLTAMKLGLSTIIQQIEEGQPVNLEQANMLQAIIDQTFDAVHRISGNLRPNILDLGLVDALDWQVSQFKKQLGVSAIFVTDCRDLECDPDESMALFRICQEALSNIAKYAQADQVSVELSLVDQTLLMTISDNGVGIAPADKIKPNSFGLRGMQERAAALGGECQIVAAANGSGTCIQVRAPFIAIAS
ncbi:MAG TPA: histidine kinase [Methylophilus sp.]|nr:histidine kinase [Methylophilus sp.]